MNQLSDTEFADLFRKPPTEAIAAWDKRTRLLTSKSRNSDGQKMWAYNDVLWNAHSRGFFVARVAQVEVLQDIQEAMDKAIREGQSFEKFRRGLKPTLQARGWWSSTRKDPEGKVMVKNPNTGVEELTRLGTPRRLRTIYDTNMAVNYSAGHYKQLKESADLLPWWRYVAIMDKRTRPTHATLHDHVYRHDDPVWGSIWPPNGWYCRCRIEPLTEREAKGTAGYVVQDPAKTVTQIRQVGTNGPSVEVTGVVGSNGHVMFPDAAWAYNPGMSNHAIEDLAWERIKPLPPTAQKAFVDTIAKDSGTVTQRRKALESWIQGVQDSGAFNKKNPQTVAVGWLPSDVLQAAKTRLGEDLSPVSLLQDPETWHARRPDKASHQKLTQEQFLQLPEILSNPNAVDWHDGSLRIYGHPFKVGKDEKVLRFVFDLVDGNPKLSTSGLVDAQQINVDPKGIIRRKK